MKIMTYNILHGEIYKSEPPIIDLSRYAETIKKYNPEIIGLNEVRGNGSEDDYFNEAEKLASLLGYHCYFGRSIYVRNTNPYGNAVLSRYPILEAKVYPIPSPVIDRGDHFEPRSVTRVIIELPSRERIAVFSSHFGLSDNEIEHATTFVAELMRDESLPFVLMGDFNTEPSSPLLAPLSEYANSNSELLEGKMSHPSDNPSIRIDHIYTSPKIKTNTIDIPDEETSDHRPIVADIDII